jgi:anti-anti-sigma factor
MADTRPFELEKRPGSVPGSMIISAAGPAVLEHLFRFQEAWRSDESQFLIFELSGVNYMDSSLIGSLVNAHVHLTKTNRKMALAAVPDRVRQILAVTKVDMLFKFYPTVEEAEAALAGAKAQAG